MEKLINLPDVSAIEEFVTVVRKSNNTVLVSKEGYKFQIDGASILGMMSVVGENIKIKCVDNIEYLSNIIDRYAVVR